MTWAGVSVITTYGRDLELDSFSELSMKSGEMSIAEQTILSELNDFIRRRKN
jgi:hypothetical protein